jgi:hypothetical protein
MRFPMVWKPLLYPLSYEGAFAPREYTTQVIRGEAESGLCRLVASCPALWWGFGQGMGRESQAASGSVEQTAT